MHPVAPGEFEIIARYFSRHSHRPDVVLGVGDDAAVLQVPGNRRLVAAIDTLVEGVHFPARTASHDIGYRAMAVNLSDLAAMGAEPAWALLSLSLPDSSAAWLEGFAAGLFEIADRYGVALVGGDTVRGPLVVTVQILGFIETDRMLTRGGARPGDFIYVSGIPGEAAAGLKLIQGTMQAGEAAAFLRQRFLRPEPRIALGRQLRPTAHAAMDISDGLLTDLRKLAQASSCTAHIDLDTLPASSPMQALFDPATCEQFALSGGDDYELLFTLPAEDVAAFEAAATLVPCTRIGRIGNGGSPAGTVNCYRFGQRVEVAPSGYDHFAT